jgi:Ca2+-binding RTX toxin-like protein
VPAIFQSGTAADDRGDRLIYDRVSGALYYDADGLGGAAQVQVATIGTRTHPTLGAGDFLVID